MIPDCKLDSNDEDGSIILGVAMTEEMRAYDFRGDKFRVPARNFVTPIQFK